MSGKQRDQPLVIYQYFLLYIYCIQLERVWPAQGLLDPRRGNRLHMTHNLAPDVQFDDYIELVAYNTRTPASLALSITAWNLMRISSFIWWTLQQFWQKMRDPIPGKTFCYATVDVLSAKALTSCSKDCHLSHETSWGWCATQDRGVFFSLTSFAPHSNAASKPLRFGTCALKLYYFFFLLQNHLRTAVNAFLRTASQGTGLTRTG